jgi:NAD+ synthase (glutamine-hydrolysing)
VVPIQLLFEQNQAVLESIYGETSFDITEENLQSRIRAVLLMAVSNKQGQLLLNTSNKSELAVGYGTLYGDMCGALSVIGDLYKTQVFALANYINLQSEIIPKSIIEKPPSAELRPNQKDSDSLPDYSILDPLLRDHLEAHMTNEMLVNKGYAKEIVERITRLVFINEHKRFQAPPVLKVSLKSFGIGRQIPLTAKQV